MFCAVALFDERIFSDAVIYNRVLFRLTAARQYNSITKLKYQVNFRTSVKQPAPS